MSIPVFARSAFNFLQVWDKKTPTSETFDEEIQHKVKHSCIFSQNSRRRGLDLPEIKRWRRKKTAVLETAVWLQRRSGRRAAILKSCAFFLGFGVDPLWQIEFGACSWRRRRSLLQREEFKAFDTAEVFSRAAQEPNRAKTRLNKDKTGLKPG